MITRSNRWRPLKICDPKSIQKVAIGKKARIFCGSERTHDRLKLAAATRKEQVRHNNELRERDRHTKVPVRTFRMI